VFAIHGAEIKPDRPHPGGWARCLPSEKRAKPAGEWNHYRVACDRGALKLAVNGKVVSGGSECKPRKGYICLESEGSECHFKNIKIHELPSSEDRGEQIADDEVAPLGQNHRALYNGLDLTGWKRDDGEANKLWQPQDWVLRFAGDADEVPSHLVSEEQFGDFELIVDWRFTGKSVQRRLPVLASDGKVAKDDGGKPVEQEVADAGQAAITFRGDYHLKLWCSPTGSGAIAQGPAAQAREINADVRIVPKEKADTALGGWNRTVLRCQDNRVSVEMNGALVVDRAKLDDPPERGPIGIHAGSPMEFANLLARPLDASDDR